MAYYIKANRLVAEHLKVDKIRLKLEDGNYMLWQADIQAFGRLYEIKQICERIGAIALQPWEARQEQDGAVLRPLPVATDARFILPAEEKPEEEIRSQSEEVRGEDVATDNSDLELSNDSDLEPEAGEGNDDE